MDTRYEKENKNDVLLMKIELQDKKQSLSHLRKKIEETTDYQKKIQRALELLKKTPSLSDALYVFSLQLQNKKLKKRCSDKIRILKKRKAEYLKALL